VYLGRWNGLLLWPARPWSVVEAGDGCLAS
jgi:hypothetical protein